jgi:hypothetical protein
MTSRARQRGDNQIHHARVLEVRIHLPPGESRANFRFLSGAGERIAAFPRGLLPIGDAICRPYTGLNRDPRNGSSRPAARRGLRGGPGVFIAVR